MSEKTEGYTLRDERNAFMQERDELLAELHRLDERLCKASGHWLSRDQMIDAITSERDEAVRERDAAVAWIDEHQIHDEDCPQGEEYKGEWDASDPHGQLQTWLGAHQNCTCGLWKLIGRTSLTTDKAAQETKDGKG